MAAAARQQIVLDGGRRIAVVLGEGTMRQIEGIMRQILGAPQVMVAQLSYLAEQASGHPRDGAGVCN